MIPSSSCGFEVHLEIGGQPIWHGLRQEEEEMLLGKLEDCQSLVYLDIQNTELVDQKFIKSIFRSLSKKLSSLRSLNILKNDFQNSAALQESIWMMIRELSHFVELRTHIQNPTYGKLIKFRLANKLANQKEKNQDISETLRRVKKLSLEDATLALDALEERVKL